MDDKTVFKAFARALDGGPMPPDMAEECAGRMERSMGFRDGILMMAVCGRDADWAARFAGDPNAFWNEMVAGLESSFGDGIDKGRLANASIALSSMALAVPEAAQPLAVAAYLHWAAGDGMEARRMVNRTFGRNPYNSLAGIVAGALQGDVKAAGLAARG